MNRIDNKYELSLNNILVFDDFISSEECNRILFELDNNLWVKSSVVSLDENNNYHEFYSDSRNSKTYFIHPFNNELRQMILTIENKITNLTNVINDKMEDWQISKYGFQEKFDFHVDSGNWKEDPAGEREKTILLYLMSPLKGGETFFRALNLYIRPLQGRLVIWDNLLSNGNSNYAMIHGGLPVKQGVKIILNTWVRQNFLTNKLINNER